MSKSSPRSVNRNSCPRFPLRKSQTGSLGTFKSAKSDIYSTAVLNYLTLVARKSKSGVNLVTDLSGLLPFLTSSLQGKIYPLALTSIWRSLASYLNFKGSSSIMRKNRGSSKWIRGREGEAIVSGMELLLRSLFCSEMDIWFLFESLKWKPILTSSLKYQVALNGN